MEDVALRNALRAAKPAQLRVHTTDRSEPEIVTVSSDRKRWAKACEVLASMAWHRIDCLDDKGRVCAPAIVDEEMEGREDEVVLDGSPESQMVAWIVNAQRLALESQRAMLQPLIDGYVGMVQTLSERNTALERAFDRMLTVAYDNALLQAQVDGAAQGQQDQLAGMLLEKITGQQGAPKKNGAANGAKK